MNAHQDAGNREDGVVWLHRGYRVALRPIARILLFLAAIQLGSRLLPPLRTAAGIAGYAPLHTSLETVAIVMSVLAFAVGWGVYDKERPGNLTLLACIFLGVALLDFLHVLSFPGMADFITPSGTEKAIGFWLAARAFAAFGLLAVALLPWRPLRAKSSRWLMLSSVLLLAGLVGWIGLAHPEALPRTFAPGQGLTRFKVAFEYVLIALYVAAALGFLRNMRTRQPYDVVGLFGAAAVMALSEVFFTFYADVTDVFNLLGHVYKAIAYGFIYNSVFIAGVREPYQRLHESRSLLQAVIDTIPIRIFWKDRESRYLGCNALFAKDAGADSPGEVIGKTAAQYKRLEQALRDSERFATEIIDALSEEICVLDETGKIVAVNKAWRNFYDSGYSHHPYSRLGTNYLEVCDAATGAGAEDAAAIAAGIRSTLQGECSDVAFEYACQSGGEQHWFRVRITPFQGDARYVVLAHENITGRKRAEESMQLATLVYQSSSEAMTVTDADNNFISVNPAFTELTGYSLGEVVGKNPHILSSGYHDQAFYEAMWRALDATGHWQGEIWDRRKNGELYAKWLTINTIYNSDGSVHRRVALFSDITGIKRTTELLWQQANFDPLTGLPNRSMFQDRLFQEIKKAHRADLPMALMFIDLDSFKEVNDTLGHDKGDALLQEVAQRLSRCVRESDLVARLGGDEFTVILGEVDDRGSVERVAQDILRKLAEPIRLGGEVAYISASIGITLYPDDATEVDSMLKSADQAMYAAKNRGRNRYSYFSPSMQEAAQARMRLLNDLRCALAGNQFRVHYQPIVQLSTGAIHKAEALIRWQHAERGLVSPAEFIPIAEDTGMIVDIGNWVFREAARQAARWRASHHADFQISVNKSPVQFHRAGNNYAAWPAYLQDLGLPGQNIVVEITEGLLMDNSAAVTGQLLAFRDAGIQVALDDFGTGYSALSYLQKFDIDYLKIDRSFVRDLAPDSSNTALCEAIIVMAHKLGIKVIAEGVETELQRSLLAAAGCDYGQGYLFSRPVPAEAFEALLQASVAS